MVDLNKLVKEKAANKTNKDASLPSTRPDTILNTVKDIPLELIKPDPNQPRKDYAADKIKSLADSIKEKGLLQPIILKPIGKDYLIIVGHRRYFAYQLLKETTIPAIVREETATEKDLTEYALLENLQREDLNALEIADGLHHLKSIKDVSQDEISKVTGYSQANISKYLQLFKAVQANPKIADKVKEIGFKMAYEKYCSSPQAKTIHKQNTAKQEKQFDKVYRITVDDEQDKTSIKKAIKEAENVLEQLRKILASL
jgi:ParB family chromosome partitioning protein